MNEQNETPSPETPPPPPPPAQPPVPAAAVAGTAELPAELADYPAQAGVVHQEEYSRWLPLVKWLLVIPHYIVLIFLGIGAAIVAFIAFFAVLFTGRYPEGLWDYMVGVQRWGMRVASYHLLMVDEYPPFSLEDDPSYPTRLVVEYPERVERWRPFVTWLLVIPYLFVAMILIWIAAILVFISFFALLFTKQFPRGMFDFVEIALRWSVRGNLYAYYLVTRYPPFAWG
jgi:Domain of unknown function (DUF4389)